MRPSIRALALLSVLLATACGGTKIEITNDTGKDLLLLEIDISGETLEWSGVNVEKTVAGSLSIPGTTVPPVATIEWDDGMGVRTEVVCLLDSASSARKIWINLAPDATSLSYTF